MKLQTKWSWKHQDYGLKAKLSSRYLECHCLLTLGAKKIGISLSIGDWSEIDPKFLVDVFLESCYKSPRRMVISILLQNKLLVSISLLNVCFFYIFFLSLYSYCIFVIVLQWSFEFLVNWFDFEKPLILLRPIGQVWSLWLRQM